MQDETLEAGSFTAALQQLTALTGLGVHDVAPEAAVPLDSLSALTRLRWLYLYFTDSERLALPSGPWLASLRHLGCMPDTVWDNRRLLGAATQLTRLSLLDEPQPWSSWDWTAAFTLLAALPNLCRLDCMLDEENYPYAPVDLLHACTQLAIRKPSLQLEIDAFDFEWPLDEMLEMPPEDPPA